MEQFVEINYGLQDEEKIRSNLRPIATHLKRTWPSLSKEGDRSRGRPIVLPELGPEMPWVKPGNFTMGSPSSEGAA